MPYSKHEPDRHFHSQLTADKFDRAFEEDHGLTDQGKSDFDNAPTADPVQDGARHGIVMESHYSVEGNGRHAVRIRYADGYEHNSVHPEQFRAHQLITKAMGLDEAPPAIKTHMRARSHPSGESEKQRLDREDGRVERESQEEPSEYESAS
jgi:hypothetical protein